MRKGTWVTSSITFVKIVCYCVLKYGFLLDVVATFLIKTIIHWPPLNALKSYSYYVLKLLRREITSWSNSPSPISINNYFSPLLFPPPFTPTMMIAIITKLQLWKKLLNSLMESMWKNMETHFGSKIVISDIMVIDSIVMTTCMSPFSKPLLDFDSMPKFSTFTNMSFCIYYSYISIWSDLTLRLIVVRATMFNKSQCKCINWIFHAFICNSIKSAMPIERFRFKRNIFNSKIQIINCNN